MAKIYNVPKEVKVPEFNFATIKEYDADLKKFKDELKDWCVKRNPNQECVGEIIKFPVADGYAEYMVAAVKPVQLIHLPIWDAWHFQYAGRLTKKDVVEKVAQQQALAKLFR